MTRWHNALIESNHGEQKNPSLAKPNSGPTGILEERPAHVLEAESIDKILGVRSESNQGRVEIALVGSGGKPGMVAAPVKIAHMEQASALVIHTQMEVNTVHRIDGDIDTVRWRDLRIFADTVAAALINSKQVETDQIGVNPYLQRSGSKWVPGIEVLVDPAAFVDPGAKELAMSTVSSVVDRLLLPSGERTKDMFSKELPETVCDAIYHSVQVALDAHGGKKIEQPVKLTVGEDEKKIEGALGAKQTHENFEPKPHACIGILVGYDVEDHEIFLKMQDKKIRISFASDHLNQLDLAAFVRDKTPCVVDTNRTISRSGKHVYSQPLGRLPFFRPATEEELNRQRDQKHHQELIATPDQ